MNFATSHQLFHKNGHPDDGRQMHERSPYQEYRSRDFYKIRAKQNTCTYKNTYKELKKRSTVKVEQATVCIAPATDQLMVAVYPEPFLPAVK